MPRRPQGLLRAVLRSVAITGLLLSLPTADAAAATLGGSIGAGATFPARTLVVAAPAGVPVTVPSIYVSENGKPVDNLSVTPLRSAGTGDFGVVLVIDQSRSMTGAPLAHAMAAARAIAAQRTGKQELGVITFDSNPSVVLPLTSDPRDIHRILATTPWTGTGTRILRALMAGLRELARANIADGSVILLSDGAATGSGSLTPQSVGAAARAQHVQIFTVGLRDRSFTPAPLRRLAKLGGGKFVAATGAQLPRVFTGITSGLTSRYLLRYRSILSAGQRVAVKVRLDGVRLPLSLSYYAPAPPTRPARTRPTTSGSVPSRSSGQRSGSASPAAGTHPAGNSPPGVKLSPTSSPTLATAPVSGGLALRVKPGRLGAAPTSVKSVPGWVPSSPPRHSFWSSSLALLLSAVGCALLIGLAIAILLFRHPAQRTLLRRVENFTLASRSDTATGLITPGPAANLLASSRRWPAFVEQVEAARMRRSPLALVKRWALGSLVVAFVVAYMTGSDLFGVLVLIAAPFAMKAVVARAVKRQRKKFNEQLPSHLQDLAGAMRGGRSFVGAISAVADSAVEPIRGELNRAVSDERLGLPLEATLEAVARRMESQDMDQVTLIAALHRRSGSNVSEALERVAESARERADLNREMRALTGQARLSAWVLSGLPPAMLGALTVVAPQYQRPLFHTIPGIVLSVIALMMVVAGWFVMKKITNPET